MRLGLARCLVLCALGTAAGCGRTQEPAALSELPTPSGNPEADYALAVRLQSEARHVESLPWFEAAVRSMPGEGRLHLDYGTALHNASIAMDTSRGAVRFAIPRSQARARLRRQALAELAQAIALARDADERAYALFSRARVLEIMGYPLDALEDLDQAQRLRADEPVLVAMRLRLEARIHPRGAIAPLGRERTGLPMGETHP